MPRRNLIWLLGISIVSLFCWAIAQGSLLPPHGPLQFLHRFPGNDLKDYERLDLLVDVLQHVEQVYVHELSDEDRRKFIESAIQGGLQSLDLHSSYVAPHEFKQFQKSSDGTFHGIGIQISLGRESKRLTVISPIVGTPAYEAGIKPGDEIEKIDGQSTQGMSLEEAVDKIQGPAGSEIQLTIQNRSRERARGSARCGQALGSGDR
jgi:carboxyl-terminal processing protease